MAYIWHELTLLLLTRSRPWAMWHLSWQMLMGQQQPALSAQPLTSFPSVSPSTPALLERSAAQVHSILHEALQALVCSRPLLRRHSVLSCSAAAQSAHRSMT